MPKVIDLFCGCGGLSEGFKLAGYTIIGGVDFNAPAIKTYSFSCSTENLTSSTDIKNGVLIPERVVFTSIKISFPVLGSYEIISQG